MKLVLHPRAASGNTLRVWAGVFGMRSAPALHWKLDGQSAVPDVIRPLESARTEEMLPSGQPGEPRAFTGVFEFKGMAPDRFHQVEVASGRERTRLDTWTLPAEVPEGLNSWFHVLLVSCFHSDEDRRGIAGAVAEDIRKAIRPHLSLFLGDQVYLDLPTLKPFRNDLPWLAKDFEEKYRHNWSQDNAASRIMNIAPSAFLADDHEYWNNYPHPATVIRLSWLQEARENWGRAARRLYEAFQLGSPTRLGEAEIINVAPLSFFLADTRSFRDEKRRFSIHPDWRPQLANWIKEIKARNWFGVFVSGQSMFDEPAGFFKGRFADYHLADYGDYKEVCAELEALAMEGRPVLFITGDVHWGRVMKGLKLADSRDFAYEVISSPASLVSTVGKDQLTALGSGIASLFGRRPRWPRHSNPGKAPERFKLGETTCQFRSLHGQKGNHFTTLSFNRIGGALKCLVRYWEIDPKKGFIGHVHPAIQFELRPAH